MAYLGTLYTDYLERTLPGQRNFQRSASQLQFVRNYVVAPASEELVFRSSMLVTTQITNTVTPRRMIYTTPLYFGIAHAHHAYEIYCQQGKSTLAIKRAALSSGTCRDNRSDSIKLYDSFRMVCGFPVSIYGLHPFSAYRTHCMQLHRVTPLAAQTILSSVSHWYAPILTQAMALHVLGCIIFFMTLRLGMHK